MDCMLAQSCPSSKDPIQAMWELVPGISRWGWKDPCCKLWRSMAGQPRPYWARWTSGLTLCRHLPMFLSWSHHMTKSPWWWVLSCNTREVKWLKLQLMFVSPSNGSILPFLGIDSPTRLKTNLQYLPPNNISLRGMFSFWLCTARALDCSAISPSVMACGCYGHLLSESWQVSLWSLLGE